MADEKLLASAAAAYRQWLLCVATSELCPSDRHKAEVSTWLALRNSTIRAYANSIMPWETTAPLIRAERHVQERVMYDFARTFARIAPQCESVRLPA